MQRRQPASKPTMSRRRIRAALLGIVAVTALLAPMGGGAQATSSGLDGIGPGSPLLINRSDGTFGCTANFIWQSGSTKYLGTAGHCLVSNTDGALATQVRVCAENCVFGATTNFVNHFLSLDGLAHLCGGSAPSCSFPVLADSGLGSDFALIPLSAVPPSSLRPEVPVFGGPSGTAEVEPDDALCMYGTGQGVGETAATKGRPAIGVSSNSTTWYANGAARIGDSGAPVVACDPDLAGAAVGIQTHVTCGVTDLAKSKVRMCGTTVARAVAIAANEELSISIVEPS